MIAFIDEFILIRHYYYYYYKCVLCVYYLGNIITVKYVYTSRSNVIILKVGRISVTFFHRIHVFTQMFIILARTGVWRFPEGSRRQGRVERYCCNVICGAPMTSEVKGLRDEREELHVQSVRHVHL